MTTEPKPPGPLADRGISCSVVLNVVLLLVIVWFGWLVLRNYVQRTGTSEAYDAINRQEHAWNEGDLDGFMDGYWRSDELTFFSGGTVTTGWEAIRQRYITRYKSEGKEMGTLDFDELQMVA